MNSKFHCYLFVVFQDIPLMTGAWVSDATPSQDDTNNPLPSDHSVKRLQCVTENKSYFYQEGNFFEQRKH